MPQIYLRIAFDGVVLLYITSDKNSARLIPGSPRRSVAITENILMESVYPKSEHTPLNRKKNASGIIFFAKYASIFLTGFKNSRTINKAGSKINSGLLFKNSNILIRFSLRAIKCNFPSLQIYRNSKVNKLYY